MFNSNFYNRRSIRLKDYDYSQSGIYFITICCHDYKCLFGEIVKSPQNELGVYEVNMVLNEFGQIAYNEWMKTSEKRQNIELGEFIVMPNHIHGIIIINSERSVSNTNENDEKNLNESTLINVENVESLIVSNNDNFANKVVCNKLLQSPSNNLGAIIRGYKATVTRQINDLENLGTIWQRNYYEHIIRSEKAYEKISDYIINNPYHWAQDRFYKNK